MGNDRQIPDPELTQGMLEDFAKNWLAHDGLWFLAVEKQYGLEKAIELDTEAWEAFTVLEAKRIMKRHNIPEGSGLDGLKKALRYRMYAVLNKQEIRAETDVSFEFYMVDCRVQSARQRKGLPLFPCKSVGIVEYREFARTIDRRISTEVIGCPPDEEAGRDFYCGWKFSLER
ncbi:MAG: hypothetical protein JSU65_13745 [Candidatus Zixiibacteriota bacterium]|nr:MAG: hypothetical protein JSU65_13745 [candidate division Zixibacteria bacterium]